MADHAVIGTLLGTSVLLASLLWPGGRSTQTAAAQTADAQTTSPTPAPAPAPAPALAQLSLDPPELLWEEGGLRVDQQRWELGEEHGRAWRVHVELPGVVQIRQGAEVQDFSLLSPQDAGPWAALNGGFYERGPMGLVVSDGVVTHPLSTRGGSGIFSWSPDVGPRIVHRRDWLAGSTQALQSIDRLVSDGKSLVNRREGARAAARSAVAISSDGLWLVALASAESLPSAGLPSPDEDMILQLHSTVVRGLPLWAFADLLIDSVHAQTALNMDGAVSTQLSAQADSHRLEIRGERGTINAVVIRPPPTP